MSDLLRICETCPWLTKNHGRKHPANWYAKANLRRLWTGLRTGNAPGMTCHSFDPRSNEYGGKGDIKPGHDGKGDIKPGHERQCAGALVLIIANINAFGKGEPQPFQPPLTRRTIADYVGRQLFSEIPPVEDRHIEVSLPWDK